MPKDEIQCDRCQHVLHFSEYSKSQRKQDDPMCLRCVAWGETQHHGVVPAPLATGHVSVEETSGELWAGRTFMTDEDYCKIQAPISGRDALGLDGEGAITDEALQAMTTRATGLAVSETQSVASGYTGKSTTGALPPHLAKRGAASRDASSASASASASATATNRALPPHLRNRPTPSASSTGPASPSSEPRLPPHLAKRAAASSTNNSISSVSTATTVREGKEEEKQNRAVDFNAWDADGNMMKKRHVPSTVASSASSARNVPAGSGTRQASGSSSFPRAPDRERPARQVDMNIVPPAGVKVGKRNFPKPKKVDEDSQLEEWPEPTW